MAGLLVEVKSSLSIAGRICGANFVEARAPHLPNRCDQPKAGDADVRKFRSSEGSNGTSFGVEQIRGLVRSSRNAKLSRAELIRPASRFHGCASRQFLPTP